jgi:hypothetical protein
MLPLVAQCCPSSPSVSKRGWRGSDCIHTMAHNEENLRKTNFVAKRKKEKCERKKKIEKESSKEKKSGGKLRKREKKGKKRMHI